MFKRHFMVNYSPKQRSRKIAVFCIFAFLIILIAGLPLADAKIFKDRVSPGVKLGGLPLGGKTKEKAQKILEEKAALFNDGLPVEFQGETKKIKNFFGFDSEQTMKKILSVGHGQGVIKNCLAHFKTLFIPETIEPKWQIDEEVFKTEIKFAFLDLLWPPKNAKFNITFGKDKKPIINIFGEETGLYFDEAKALADLKNRLNNFSLEPIKLEGASKQPEILTKDLAPFFSEVEKILQSPAPEIKWHEESWPIDSQKLASWLEVEKKEDGFNLAISQSALKIFLVKIAKKIDRLPQNAVFELEEGQEKVNKFIPAAPGYQVYLNKNVEKIKNELIEKVLADRQNGEKVVFELITGETPAKISTGDTNQLGIKEQVGLGQTNFRGSPTNRIKNIKRGASILNNLLIKPGEEFSLLEHLRPFTEENGYLKELVIKPAEGRTVPEIGGGLCQIGTTAFRVALNAGVPITARTNHFYRVPYYEPPVGMDATIYDPAPDFRFINDTGHYLLLRTLVQGNNLIFELWGAPDGRQVEISQPEIFNVVKPPAKKTIETLDLKPGQLKCTEKAHVGSDATFNYRVSYANGEIKEKEFFSRYRPWQEVCLLGVEKLTEPPPSEPAPPEPASGASPTLSDLEILGTPVVRD